MPGGEQTNPVTIQQQNYTPSYSPPPPPAPEEVQAILDQMQQHHDYTEKYPSAPPAYQNDVIDATMGEDPIGGNMNPLTEMLISSLFSRDEMGAGTPGPTQDLSFLPPGPVESGWQDTPLWGLLQALSQPPTSQTPLMKFGTSSDPELPMTGFQWFHPRQGPLGGMGGGGY